MRGAFSIRCMEGNLRASSEETVAQLERKKARSRSVGSRRPTETRFGLRGDKIAQASDGSRNSVGANRSESEESQLRSRRDELRRLLRGGAARPREQQRPRHLRQLPRAVHGPKAAALAKTNLLAAQFDAAESTGDAAKAAALAGACHCPFFGHGCEAPAFDDKAVASHTTAEVFAKYLEAKTLLPAARRVQQVLQKRQELRLLVPNARQCGRCSYGPVVPEACSNLASHHGELRRGQAVPVDNSCPRCGWFVEDSSQWPTWEPSGLAADDPLDAAFNAAADDGGEGDEARRRGGRRASRLSRFREERCSARGKRQREAGARGARGRMQQAMRREHERQRARHDAREAEIEAEIAALAAVDAKPTAPAPAAPAGRRRSKWRRRWRRRARATAPPPTPTNPSSTASSTNNESRRRPGGGGPRPAVCRPRRAPRRPRGRARSHPGGAGARGAGGGAARPGGDACARPTRSRRGDAPSGKPWRRGASGSRSDRRRRRRRASTRPRGAAAAGGAAPARQGVNPLDRCSTRVGSTGARRTGTGLGSEGRRARRPAGAGAGPGATLRRVPRAERIAESAPPWGGSVNADVQELRQFPELRQPPAVGGSSADLFPGCSARTASGRRRNA